MGAAAWLVVMIARVGVSTWAEPAANVTVTLELGERDLPAKAQALLDRLIGPHAAARSVQGRRIYQARAWPPGLSPGTRDRLVGALRAACACEVSTLQVNPSLNRSLGRARGFQDQARQTTLYDGARSGATAAEAAVVAPTPASVPAELYPLIESVAREPDVARAGVTPRILFALAKAASGLRTDFRFGDVYGVMGISLTTARELGYTKKDLLKPRLNLEIGATILGALLREFDGDLRRALAGYQAGPSAVLRSQGILDDPKVGDLLAAFDRAYREAPPTALRKPRRAVGDVSALDVARRRRLYEGIAAAIAKGKHADPDLIIAMLHVENEPADPQAVSRKNARGLLQMTPPTAMRMGVKNPVDPIQNLSGGTGYVQELLQRFHGDLVLAVAAYNCGPGCIERSGYKVPCNAETPGYLRKVFNDYNKRTGRRIDVEPYMACQ